MGDRYFLTVVCPDCGEVEEEVYYAPTCGFKTHKCHVCHEIIDLEKYSGISEEDASNRALFEEVAKNPDLAKQMDESPELMMQMIDQFKNKEVNQ